MPVTPPGAAYLAGDADADQRRHLSSCPQCRAARPELDVLKSTLDDPGFWEEPSGDLEDRITTLVSGGSRPVFRRPPWQRWAAAAAAVVLFVAAAGVFVAGREPAPDWEVPMPGTIAAPDADGLVMGWSEAGGTRLRFEITGLPEAPPGSVYEVWFSRGPIHISAGTFAAAGEVDMWTGIARPDYPRIWITLEPLDEDESPSATTVMDTADSEAPHAPAAVDGNRDARHRIEPRAAQLGDDPGHLGPG